MANACVFLMNLPEDAFGALISGRDLATIAPLSQSDPVWIPPLVNIGCGEDVTSKELAKLVRRVAGFEGKIVVDASKPEGTPRKSVEVSHLKARAWFPSTYLRVGLSTADSDYQGAFIKGLVALMAEWKATRVGNGCIQGLLLA